MTEFKVGEKALYYGSLTEHHGKTVVIKHIRVTDDHVSYHGMLEGESDGLRNIQATSLTPITQRL